MKVQILFVLAIVSLSAVSAKSSAQVFCGRKLADTLAYFCYDDSMEKRSSANSVEDFGYGWSWAVPRARALEGARGKRTGVVTECCDKPCTLNELLSYC